ncbi:hypothetical protein [Victivallis vadensis]|uniref:hypothetical protein n=1 Tax=Victivallis vadensis TaxID=172901 RepID=UPI00307F5FF5
MKRIRAEVVSGGCFLDIHSTHLPWWRVDFRPGVPGAGMMRGTLVPTNRLWRMAREIYGGPVFGESYALTSWIHSGNVDSMVGQASRNSGLILDFLLLKIRPLAIYHGAGYFERWSAATWPAGGTARCPRRNMRCTLCWRSRRQWTTRSSMRSCPPRPITTRSGGW